MIDDTLISYVETLERCSGERPAGSGFFCTFDDGETALAILVVADPCAASRLLLDQEVAAPGEVGAAVCNAAAGAWRAGVSDAGTARGAAGMSLRDALAGRACGSAGIVEQSMATMDLAADAG